MLSWQHLKGVLSWHWLPHWGWWELTLTSARFIVHQHSLQWPFSRERGETKAWEYEEQNNSLKLLVQLVASLEWSPTEQIAGGALVLPLLTEGVTLGGIQTSTAASHLCLIRDRGNGINHGYGITWVSYDACKDIGILQLKETLS